MGGEQDQSIRNWKVSVANCQNIHCHFYARLQPHLHEGHYEGFNRQDNEISA